MNPEIQVYTNSQTSENKMICELVHQETRQAFPDAESKIWHGAPVWFLDGNPVVGYDVLKNCVRLLFWSGQSFDEPGLKAGGSFKAAGLATLTSSKSISTISVVGWISLKKSNGTIKTSLNAAANSNG